MKKFIITCEEYNQVLAAIRKNRDKKTDKRLRVIALRYEGHKDKEIAERLGFNIQYVSRVCAQFKKRGLTAFININYGGNHRNMTYKEEEEILSEYIAKAEQGQIIVVSEIKAAFDQRLGKETDSGYIYRVLARHKWRKVKPRSRHPKKASPEVIEASKKLIYEWSNY